MHDEAVSAIADELELDIVVVVVNREIKQLHSFFARASSYKGDSLYPIILDGDLIPVISL